MAERSVALNHQEHRMTMRLGDLRDIRSMGYDSSMNIVTVNPPYMKAGLRNQTDRKLISRHEVLCTLEDVCAAAAFTLKSNGRLFMVHRPNRLQTGIFQNRQQPSPLSEKKKARETRK